MIVGDKVLLFDKECEFCNTNIVKMANLLNSSVSASHYKDFDFTEAPLQEIQAAESLVFVDEDKNCYFGAKAFAKWLQTGNLFWKIVGKAIDLPGIAVFAKLTYAIVRKVKHKT